MGGRTGGWLGLGFKASRVQSEGVKGFGFRVSGVIPPVPLIVGILGVAVLRLPNTGFTDA